MIVVRMTRLEKLVAASFIFMLLIVTIVPIYGLSEEEAEEFYQKFKEAIEYLDFTLPGETEKTISEQTAETINTKIRTTALELISTPEFIEEFK